MSVSGLKAELKFLESIFDTNHERFRIIDWKPDELSCQFNVTGEKLLIIHCNITVRNGTLLAAKGLAYKRKSWVVSQIAADSLRRRTIIHLEIMSCAAY